MKWNRLRCPVKLVFLLAAGWTSLAAPADAAEKVTYLLPAPLSRPAFAPWVLAKAHGHYAAEGLDIEFQTVGGGAEVAKQVGIGNAIIGDALGDTPIIVRAHGVPVRAVALMGGGSFTQLIVATDSSITTPADLKGRTVSVLSYTDTTYYALLGALAKSGLTKNDLTIIAGGPSNVWALFLNKQADAMAVAPDYIAYVTNAGAKIRVIPVADYFETMAQAQLASDKAIKEQPDLIRRIVRATLRGMQDVLHDPAASLRDFIAATPENTGKEAELAQVFEYYRKYVFSGQNLLGEMDEQRLAKLQQFYLAQGIVDKAVPVAELYTNEFVK